MIIPFYKACGLGNDFVILVDVEILAADLSTFAVALADRRYGIGCDQVILISSPLLADIERSSFDKKNKIYGVRYFNSDGSEAEACGNGSRCAALLLMAQDETNCVTLKTKGGDLVCTLIESETPRSSIIAITMEKPTWIMDFEQGSMGRISTPEAVFVNVGNPHLVCFVADPEMVTDFGPGLEHHPAFAHGVNVGFVSVINRTNLQLRVWERGVGITPACGTGACAAMVAAHLRGLVDDRVVVEQPGGKLLIHWRLETQPLVMEGPAHITYKGEWYVAKPNEVDDLFLV